LRAPVDASRLSEPEGRLSVCASLTRRGRTPLALASCAGSRFRETNHEFVQSNECEPMGMGRCVPEGIVSTPATPPTLTLDPSQERAVELVCTARFGVVTGGPGVGKSTCLSVALDRLDARGESYALAAPTGKAARRMAEVTGRHARTVHRLLDFGPDDRGQLGFRRNAHNPIDEELVVIDEASMLDVELARAVVRAIDPRRTRLILVGDANQLPSVGPGRVFGDIIESGAAPVARLTVLHRAAAQSWICTQAPVILSGSKPDLEDRHDFRWIERASRAEAVDALVEAVFRDLPSRGVTPSEIQVLIPQRVGPAGCELVNPRLQALLNPERDADPAGWKVTRSKDDEGRTLRLRDRVIQTRNDYDLGVMNGEVGEVVAITNEPTPCTLCGGTGATKRGEQTTKCTSCNGTGRIGPRLTVRYPADDGERDRRVAYDKTDVSSLDLAYALTIHKCVSPDTLIETEVGLLRIDEVTDDCGLVGTAEGSAVFTKVVRNGKSKALRIKTRRGYELTITPEHKMMAWTGEKYALVEAQHLRVGQFLRLLRGSALDAGGPSALPEAPVGDVRSIPIVTPKVVSAEVAEWLGLVVADGTVTPGSVRLAKRHPDVVQRFADLTNSIFGRACTVSNRRGYQLAEICSKPLVTWLASVGGVMPNAKNVPACVRRSSLAHQAAFLRGLFEDGSVAMKRGKVDHVEWTTAVEEMSRTVQVMLLRLGITSSRARYQNIWRISIYGSAIDRFSDHVGFISRAKAERLALPHSNDSRDRIPLSRAEASWSEAPNAKTYGYVSREKAKDLGAATPRLAFVHDEIDTITPVECESMCLTVPSVGRFLQNGFDGSNSQGSQWPWLAVLCHSTHTRMLTRQLLYTGITRAQRGVVLVGDEIGLGRAVKNVSDAQRNTGLVERLRSRQPASVVAPSAAAANDSDPITTEEIAAL